MTSPTDIDADDDFAFDMTERFMPGKPVAKLPEVDKIQQGFNNAQWLIAQGIREGDPAIAAVKGSK